MTKKRRYLISAAILAGVVAVVLGVLAMLPQPGPTKANFDRIQEGMTRAEVEVILAGPPRVDLDGWVNEKGGTGLGWWFDTGDWKGARVMVNFMDGRVKDKSFLGSSESLTDKLRRWLGQSNAMAGAVPLPAALPPP